jgi:hypothetical protein
MAKDIVAVDVNSKFLLKITNKSSSILLYKPEESTFKINSTEVKPKEKWLTIYPGDTEGRVIDIKGTSYRVPEYNFVVNGIYKISESDRVVEAPDFQLPPSANDFKAGNFSCTMLNLSKESDKTSVKFECRYTGDKVGVINPGRAAVKLPDNSEIANAKSKSKSEILMKGESTKITLNWNRMEGGRSNDMQLIKLQILWRNTFVEADPVKLEPVELMMKQDEALSK